MIEDRRDPYLSGEDRRKAEVIEGRGEWLDGVMLGVIVGIAIASLVVAVLLG